MNWRRGLLLAGINLGVALPMVVILETKDAQSLRMRQAAELEAERETAARSQTQKKQVPTEENSDETISYDPCLWTVHYPVPVVVEQSATLPTLVFTGWRMECAARWSLGARMGTNVLWVPRIKDEASLNAARRKVDKWFLAALVAQWFFMGSFPLFRSKQWWAEPGMFITLCTVIAGSLALVPAIEPIAQLTALIAMLAWLWYFGLLLWNAVHLAWQSTLYGFRRLS